MVVVTGRRWGTTRMGIMGGVVEGGWPGASMGGKEDKRGKTLG